MFENIIGNRSIAARLEREIRTGTPAHAMLFVGNDFSGKISCALETARALNCSEGGEWNCGCRSCVQSRFLKNPYLFLTGPYSDFYEIRLTAELLKNRGDLSSLIKFVRALRKLAMRFDSRILTEEDAKKIDKEALLSIGTGAERLIVGDFSSEEQRLLQIDEAVTAAERLASQAPASFSVHAVRNLISESYIGTEGKKIIIIEAADTLSVASSNALLKILEEPPVDTYFILTAVRQSAVLPTVLSRLRIYAFSDRSREEDRLLLKLFFGYEGELSLGDFILKHSGTNLEEINAAVDDFFAALIDENGWKRFYSVALFKTSDRRLFTLFWRRLSQTAASRFAAEIKTDPVRQMLYARIQRVLNEGLTALTEAHQSPEAVAETSFIKIKKILSDRESSA